MSVLQPWVYTNEQRRADVAAALGGEVWFDEHVLFWRPEGHTRVVSIAWRDLHEPFDGDEWAEALRGSWVRAGAVV